MNYKLIYDNLILKRRQFPVEGYSERHHILPRSLGGTDDEDNIVILTAKEHLIAHLLLLKIYPNNRKLFHAVWMMTNMNKYTSKDYSYLREKFFSIPISDETRKRLSDSRKKQSGIKQSKEQIERRVAKNTGQKRTPEQKENISNGLRCVIFTEERLLNMSKAKMGIPWSEERKQARKGYIPWNKGLFGYKRSKKDQKIFEDLGNN